MRQNHLQLLQEGACKGSQAQSGGRGKDISTQQAEEASLTPPPPRGPLSQKRTGRLLAGAVVNLTFPTLEKTSSQQPMPGWQVRHVCSGKQQGWDGRWASAHPSDVWTWTQMAEG